MPRIAKYDPVADAITSLVSITPAPVILTGKKVWICSFDGTRVAVYNIMTGALYEWLPGALVTDCGEGYVIAISGTVVKVFRADGSLAAQYDEGFQIAWAAYKSFGKYVVVGSNKVRLRNIITGASTDYNVDPNAQYVFVDCNELGYCVVTSNIHNQGWHGTPGYVGPDYPVIGPDDSLIVILAEFRLSSAFVSRALAGDHIIVDNHEQNGVQTNIIVHGFDPTQFEWYGCSGPDANNPCVTAASAYVGIGNADTARVAVRKTDGSTACITLPYSLQSGACYEYGDGSKTLCIIVDKDRNVRRLRIDRSTGTLIDDIVISTLTNLPQLFKPVPI